MYWANFLHIYQPPTQTDEIIRKVTEESYRPLMRILKEYSNAKVTLNINACLTEHLIRCGFSDVIEDIGQLAQEGRIELTGSAKFHPILPLISKDEIKRQIELNQQSNERYFKGVYRPKGFFSPEMCYSQEMAAIIKEMGFEWMILDEIAYNGRLGRTKNDCCYIIESLAPLKVFFKERKVSMAITFGQCSNISDFMGLNKDVLSKNAYLLTGTDGEVYGHHRFGQERLLEQIYNEEEMETVTVSELSGLFEDQHFVEPVASSWSTWEDEIEQGLPYPQWDDPANPIHQKQWELAMLAIELLGQAKEKYEATPEWQRSRQLLDEALHSCQWWWASCRPWWGISMVKRGTDILFETIAGLRSLGLEHTVLGRAESLKKGIEELLHEWETTGKARQKQEGYLRSHAKITNLLRFG